MIKKIVLSLITVLSFCSLALAQNKQVTGTVTDEKGEPIIGATVVAEGTSAGTTTGGDGQFTLTVPANATLSISFIGYETQKVSVAGKTHIDVTLGEEATGIEDVVVIGMVREEDRFGDWFCRSGEVREDRKPSQHQRRGRFAGSGSRSSDYDR